MNKFLTQLSRPAVYWSILAFVIWVAVTLILPTETVRMILSLIAGWQVGRWISDLYNYHKRRE